MPIWDFKDIRQEAFDELFTEREITWRPVVEEVREVALNKFEVSFGGHVPRLSVLLIPGRAIKLCVRDTVLRNARTEGSDEPSGIVY